MSGSTATTARCHSIIQLSNNTSILLINMIENFQIFHLIDLNIE